MKNLFRFFIVFLLLHYASCTLVIRTPFIPPKNKKPNLYRGVYHVHSEFSHDSKVGLPYIVETAKKAGLDFVVVTDHNNMNAKKAYQARSNEDPLLIFGTEISTWYDGHLGVIGAENPPFNLEHIKEIVEIVHEQGGYVIPAHPYSRKKPWKKWDIPYDGIEVFCFSDFFYELPTHQLIFKAFFLPSNEFLKSVLAVKPENMKRWDEELTGGKKISGFGAVDAHIKFRLGNFIPENYLLSFQSVTMYVVSEDKSEKKIVENLIKGNSFIAFEIWGLANEFSFAAIKDNASYGQIVVKSPKSAQIKLIHNGTVVAENQGEALNYAVKEAGYYRSEVYLEDKLWIISNPIYIE